MIGNLARDVVDGGPPRVGGAPFYTARALRVLGVPAVIVTKGRARELAALGLRVGSRPVASTTAFTIVNHEGGRQMSVGNVGETWTPQDASGWVASALQNVRWVHVAPLLRCDFPAETLAVLARGRRLCLDGQGLVRVRKVGPLELDSEFDRTVLQHLTVLKLAQQEADVVLGEVSERSLRSLGVPEVIVTRGEAGSTVFAAGRVTEVAGASVRGVADPTGAGDGFAAGYVAARSTGHSPVAAARRASALVAGLLSARLS